jgi:Zn-dependent M16 (insulinase) family peptidase
MGPKSDIGAKFDKGKKERILALSLELSDQDLAEVIQFLLELQTEHNKKNLTPNVDTISI